MNLDEFKKEFFSHNCSVEDVLIFTINEYKKEIERYKEERKKLHKIKMILSTNQNSNQIQSIREVLNEV